MMATVTRPGGVRETFEAQFLAVPPVVFEPTSELVACATACALGCAGGRVLQRSRDQLQAAASALPQQGLPSAWYHLAAIARAYCRDWDGKGGAPPMNFAPLIIAAVDAGTGTVAAWQERMQ